MWKVVAAGAALALIAWSVFCIELIAEELAVEYDGFFTDISVALFVIMLVIPWVLVGTVFWAVRDHRAHQIDHGEDRWTFPVKESGSGDTLDHREP